MKIAVGVKYITHCGAVVAAVRLHVDGRFVLMHVIKPEPGDRPCRKGLTYWVGLNGRSPAPRAGGRPGPLDVLRPVKLKNVRLNTTALEAMP